MSTQCRFYGTPVGCRYGTHCFYSHDFPLQIQTCRYFNTPSGCRFGSQCRNKHELNDRLQNKSKSMLNPDANNTINDNNDDDNKDDNDNNDDSNDNNDSNSDANNGDDICDDYKQQSPLLKPMKDVEREINEKLIKYHWKTNGKSLIGDFYVPLRLDYEPMTALSGLERINIAKQLKTKGNKMYSTKEYLKSIKYYRQAITLLDSCFFDNQSNVHEINNLLSVILSNTAQCWLSYSEIQHQKDQYNLCLCCALNCSSMSIWLNRYPHQNLKAFYRKILCVYQLGLFEYGDYLIKELDNITNDKNTDNLIQILKKKKLKKKNIQQFNKIKDFKEHLVDLGKDCDFSEINIDHDMWSAALNWQYALLSVSELLRTKKWLISDCIQWLTETINNADYSLYPRNMDNITRNMSEESEQLKCYSIGFIAIILSYKPQQIGEYLDHYFDFGDISSDEWEIFADRINYFKMADTLWICEEFWSIIVDDIVNKTHFEDEIKIAIQKKTLRHIQIKNADERHSKWKLFYDKDKQNNNHNVLPAHGRLNKLPRFNFKKGNDVYICQDDLINIHAIATSRNQFKVIKEIENVIPFTLYHMGFTWLHEFAKNGCYDTCKFLVSLGMDVNVIDRVKHGGRRMNWYSEPVTPIDYIIKQFVDDFSYYCGTDERNAKLRKVVITLRNLGGKRFCELKDNKGDYKESKIFEKIMNGQQINDQNDSDNEEYGYEGILQYM